MVTFSTASLGLNKFIGVEFLILAISAFFSSALTSRGFFSDLRGISLSSWDVTTTGRKWLVLFVGILCGLCNYISLIIVSRHLTGFWLALSYGLMCIMPGSLCGYFFEKTFIKLKYSLKK